LIPPIILKQKFFLKTIGLSKEIEKSKIDQNQKLKVRINEFCKKETKKDAIPDNSLFCWSKRSRTLSQPGKKAISYRTLTKYRWITVFL
jgi:hypothetical protein